MLITLAISGYRSIRDLTLPLEQLTVITGANGTGKSSLYRSLRLLAGVAQGRVIGELAREGGLQSTLWAGPEVISPAMRRGDVPVQGAVRDKSVALKLGFASEDYGYAIDLGLPLPTRTAFGRDPEIKAEALWIGEELRRVNVIAARKGPGVHVTDRHGEQNAVLTSLAPFDSMMTHAAGPDASLELLAVRERMKNWRFYDALRTDPDAPARGRSVGTRTTALASDGHNVAAAIQTILEVGDGGGFDRAIDSAFPGSSVTIDTSSEFFGIQMQQHGLLRPLSAPELSDGTLRYILLVTALLSPSPPPLLVLNEPETSLHPSLIEPLAELIARASQKTQIIVVSHDSNLVRALSAAGAICHRLRKDLGETQVECDASAPWAWPKRS